MPGSPPIDSTASVDPGTGNLLVDAGNAAEATDGGYYAYSPSGGEVWNQVVTNPATDTVPDGGVQASMSVAPGEGIAEAGSLGQQTNAWQSGSGAPARGWPQFTPDSVFSTAAVGDLYGTGSADFISGGATSSGFAYGTHYSDGGQLRIFNDHGGLVCHANTTEEIDSSPAVGPILAGGGLRHCDWYRQLLGATTEDTRQGLRHEVQPGLEHHPRRLHRREPGAGRHPRQRRPAVVEGTATGDGPGSGGALNAANGATPYGT